MAKTPKHYKDYLAAKKANPDKYQSYEDYLGANGLAQCEGCSLVFEYDEVDENGHCKECQECGPLM